MITHNKRNTFFGVISIMILFSVMVGCATIHKSDINSDSRIYLSELNTPKVNDDYRKIHKKFRPLERPQIKYAIE